MCFIIGDDNLYLEQILVDYTDIPIFFLCKGDQHSYYLVLCTDPNKLLYIVTQISLADVSDLLHGNIAMRDAILKQKNYWMVYCAAKPSKNQVEKHEMKDLDKSLLPEGGVPYKVLTQSMKNYINRFDLNFQNEV